MNDPTTALLAGAAVFLAYFIGTIVLFLRSQGNTIKKVSASINEAMSSGLSDAIKEPVKSISESTLAVNKMLEQLINSQNDQTAVLKYVVEANNRILAENAVQKARADLNENKAKELEKRIEDSTRAVNDLLRTQEERTRQSRDQEEKLKALEGNVGILNAALTGVNETLEKTSNDLKDIQQKYADTLRQLEKTQADLTVAEGRIAALEKQLETARSEKAALEIELKTERDKVQKLEGEVKTLKQQVGELQAQLDAQGSKP